MLPEELLRSRAELLCAGPDVCRSGPDVLRSRGPELLRSRAELLPAQVLQAALLQAQVLQSEVPESALLQDPLLQELLRSRAELLCTGAELCGPDGCPDVRRSGCVLLPLISNVAFQAMAAHAAMAFFCWFRT